MDTYFLTCINTVYESILYHVEQLNMLASFFLVVSNVPFPGLSLIFLHWHAEQCSAQVMLFMSSCGSLPSLISSPL